MCVVVVVVAVVVAAVVVAAVDVAAVPVALCFNGVRKKTKKRKNVVVTATNEDDKKRKKRPRQRPVKANSEDDKTIWAGRNPASGKKRLSFLEIATLIKDESKNRSWCTNRFHSNAFAFATERDAG